MEARYQRRLTLLRHAHAAPGDTSTPDRDRPLDSRGEQEAKLIGQRLHDSGARPSLIITSPAARASRTARLIASVLGYPQEFVQREASLYLANPADLLLVIAAQDDAFMDMLVCAHNPGLSELASQLTHQTLDSLPTAGLVTIGLDARTWSGTTAGGALIRQDDPHQAAAFDE